MRTEGQALIGPDVDNPLDRALLPRSRRVLSVLGARAVIPSWTRRARAAENRGQGSAPKSHVSSSDYNLQSTALDALGSIAQGRFAWRRSVTSVSSASPWAAKLALFERSMPLGDVAWGAVIAATWSLPIECPKRDWRSCNPARCPIWAIHLAAWRLVGLTLAGGWDEVEALAERSNRMWLEAGRPPAGYSMRGWMAALIVAHARRDEARVGRWTEILWGALRAVPPSHRLRGRSELGPRSARVAAGRVELEQHGYLGTRRHGRTRSWAMPARHRRRAARRGRRS